MTFKVLCCDGGGIRGLIAALLIQNPDDDSGLISTADGFAGASPGGPVTQIRAYLQTPAWDAVRSWVKNHWRQLT